MESQILRFAWAGHGGAQEVPEIDRCMKSPVTL